jgi:spore coat polysaccharide biosynthesis protein SpsF
MIMSGCLLRYAADNEEDCRLLYNWRNDAEVRKNSFHQDEIAYKDHEKWFHAVLKDPNRRIYIMMARDIMRSFPVGVIRADVDGDEAELSYSIDRDQRSKGYGTEIVNLASEEIPFDYPDVKKLTAKVKTDNTYSQTIFVRNGFFPAKRLPEYILYLKRL